MSASLGITVVKNPSFRVLKSVLSLGESVWGDEFDIDLLSELEDVFVALVGDEVAGYAFLIYDEEHDLFDLRDLCVAARYRGKGVGSRLLHALFVYAKEEYDPPHTFGLVVRPDNETAIHLYKKHGFVQRGEAMINYYGTGGDGLFFQKTL